MASVGGGRRQSGMSVPWLHRVRRNRRSGRDHSGGCDVALRERLSAALVAVSLAAWHDARHQYEAIDHQAPQLTALHAVAVMADTAGTATTGRTCPHPIPRRGVAEGPGAAVVDPAAAQGRAGRPPGRPWHTRLPRCVRLRRSATTSRSARPCLTLGTSFSAMRGTIGEDPPRSCTICSYRAVSRSGSARRTSPSAPLCSAK